MNPSYFRIKLPFSQAVDRLCEWTGVKNPSPMIETDSVKAVELACTEQGTWKLGALFISQVEDWTVFSDLTGAFSSITAGTWLGFAKRNEFVAAGYNDTVPYGELVVISNGEVLREFMDYPDEPEENRDLGCLPGESENPIKSWIEVASFVDDDELGYSDDGWLWVQESSGSPDPLEQEDAQTNLRRWIGDGGPADWVQVRRGQWTDRDWEALIEELKGTEYWPLDPNKVGEELEKATREWEKNQ